MSRSDDLLLLLSCGLALGACAPTVEPNDDDDGPNGSGGDDRDAVEDAIDLCGPWVDKTVECYEESLDEADYGYSVSYVSMMGYCIAQVGYAQTMGDDCVAAYDDYFVCLANVGCAEIFGDVEASDDAGDQGETPEDDYPCAEHEAAIEAACEGPVVGDDFDED